MLVSATTFLDSPHEDNRGTSPAIYGMLPNDARKHAVVLQKAGAWCHHACQNPGLPHGLSFDDGAVGGKRVVDEAVLVLVVVAISTTFLVLR